MNRKQSNFSKLKYYLLLPLFILLILSYWCFRGLSDDKQSANSKSWLNQRAPKFLLPDLFAEKDLYDQAILNLEPTIVHVFSSWCKACHSEHELLLSKQGKFKAKLLGINFFDDPVLSRDWLKQYGNPYDLVLSDEKNQFSLDWGVIAPPETIVVRKGVICYRKRGPIDNTIWLEKILPCVNK